MKKLTPFLLCSLLALSGCFNIETSLVLEEDLSGTAGLSLTIDMEPMAYIMATMQRAFTGEEGPPTAEDIDAARQELLEDMEGEEELSDEEMWREAEEDLPEGFVLRELNVVRDGLKTRMHFLVDFPHIDRLHELKLDEPGKEESEEMPGAPSAGQFKSLSEPFTGFRFVDEGSTYLLESEAPNPVEEAKESGSGMEGIDEMLEKVFADLHIAMTIQVPGEIVEHNATRVEGKKLIWEFSFETLGSGAATDLDYMMVRFKK